MDDLRHERRLIESALREKFGGHTIFVCRKLNQEKQYSIWYARVSCMTASQNRILAVLVPLEVYHTPGSTAPLDQLPWIGFQARETTDQALLTSLEMQSCTVRPNVSQLSKEVLRQALFNVKYKSSTSWTYLSDQLPSLRVDLLLEKESQTFREQGTLEQCLDIYQTCLAWQLQL